MPERKIRENIESLRHEIASLASDKVEAKERLNALINDIEASIDSESEEEDVSLIQSLKDAVGQFETEHPRATAILNDIMVTLSNMGI